MATDLNEIIGWSLIGTPDGMQANSGGCIANYDISNIVDIDNRYIEIFPDTQLLSFFRENFQDHIVSYYGLYNHAKEIKSNRPGTFYGSVLVLINHVIDSEVAYNILNELCNHISKNIILNNRFTSNLKTLNLPNVLFYNNLISYIKPINENINLGKGEGFKDLNNNDKASSINFFDLASRIDVNEVYFKFFGSSNNEIKQSVLKKDRYKIITNETLKLELQIHGLKIENNKLIKELDESSENIKNEKLKVETLNNSLITKEKEVEELQRTNLALLNNETYSLNIQKKDEKIQLLESQIGSLKLQVKQLPFKPSSQIQNPYMQYGYSKKKRQTKFDINDFIHSRTGLLFFLIIFLFLMSFILTILYFSNSN